MPLPERDGIPPSRVYLPEGPWERLLDFLSERFPRMPQALLLSRLEAGDIVDEYGVAQRADTPYQARRWLWYYREVPDEVPVPFELPVLYRDARLVVVDKPHFMATTPSGRYLRHTALVRLRNELGLSTLSPIHRLDRETAGVLVFCVDPAYRGRYQALFQAREVGKEYEAVARPPAGFEFPLVYRSRMEEMLGRFLMHEVAGPANSETRIELLSWLGDNGLAHLRLEPLTGRKHQLRVHLNALGMPIVNDSFYPPAPYDENNETRAEESFQRPLQLLARAIEFRDPVDGRTRRFESVRTLSCVESGVPEC
ncbi:pseudouridine synthase [Achromobacter sp. F4_2707]|uniref:pseudouridine synthase n=1 Tax=Achromobacter sp. F4_2707 TaxID=3114286 RepID=UPI0039C65FBE